MRLPLEPGFHLERRRFNLRFCCEDCTYLDREHQRCVHGWPQEEHRARFYDDPGCREIIFCKEFELI